MLKAKFSLNEDTGLITLKVKGHANQAEKGKDIVCASATILSYTVAQIVKNIYSRGGHKKPPTIKLSDGYAHISCYPTEDAYEEVLHTYLVAQVGFGLLAHNYPKYVSLTAFGEV